MAMRWGERRDCTQKLSLALYMPLVYEGVDDGLENHVLSFYALSQVARLIIGTVWFSSRMVV